MRPSDTDTFFHIPWMTLQAHSSEIDHQTEDGDKQRNSAMHVKEQGLLLWAIKVAAI